MFSLCIPTFERFDHFLVNYLPKYIENEYIDEIVITDETGNDVDKIINKFGDNPKLKLIKNESKLGPFLNKIKACSNAKNEWIVLIDSDNFADEQYFKTAKTYLEQNSLLDKKNIILAPSKAKPNFNYSHLSGFVCKNGDFSKNKELEKTLIQSHNVGLSTLMNTGNYVINKYLIDTLDLTNEKDNVSRSSACDVIYFNTLLFEQLDLNLHIVPGLEYEHVVHNGSVYATTESLFRSFNQEVYRRYDNLI